MEKRNLTRILAPVLLASALGNTDALASESREELTESKKEYICEMYEEGRIANIYMGSLFSLMDAHKKLRQLNPERTNDYKVSKSEMFAAHPDRYSSGIGMKNGLKRKTREIRKRLLESREELRESDTSKLRKRTSIELLRDAAIEASIRKVVQPKYCRGNN
jgi:hypothetical protein|tara:strand:- start:155 stop:640 length:486 start_codon:yes stop_codon:yes gene_type:complete